MTCGPWKDVMIEDGRPSVISSLVLPRVSHGAGAGGGGGGGGGGGACGRVLQQGFSLVSQGLKETTGHHRLVSKHLLFYSPLPGKTFDPGRSLKYRQVLLCLQHGFKALGFASGNHSCGLSVNASHILYLLCLWVLLPFQSFLPHNLPSCRPIIKWGVYVGVWCVHVCK